MAIETERRFLLANDSWRDENVFRSQHVRQGYLSDNPERTVRVRITEQGTFGHDSRVTIKGPKINGSGLEFEYRIPVNDAEQLLSMCQQPVLDKTRNLIDTKLVDSDNNIQYLRWEIDVFHGDNEGLILAEVEFDGQTIHYKDNVILPSWIGEEVTDNMNFANSNLARYPYNTWSTLFY